MGDVSNQKLTCCWSSSLLYLALGEWTRVPGLHERTDKGIGWLGPLFVDSHDSQAATVPAPALQHYLKYQFYPLSHLWSTSSLLSLEFFDISVSSEKSLSETLFRLFSNCVSTIVWLCVRSVNVVWGFEIKYTWRREEEVYENPWLGFKQWWLRIVYAGVCCAGR